MSDMEKFRWEMLQPHNGGVENTQRAMVPGGWIVCHIMWHEDSQKCSESMVFIPDPEHKWEAPNE